jgi:hypothetical protein
MPPMFGASFTHARTGGSTPLPLGQPPIQLVGCKEISGNAKAIAEMPFRTLHITLLGLGLGVRGWNPLLGKIYDYLQLWVALKLGYVSLFCFEVFLLLMPCHYPEYEHYHLCDIL